VFNSRNRRSKIAQIHVYTHGLDNSLLLYSQLPSCRYFRVHSTQVPHTYSVTQSPLSSHVIGEAIHTRKSLKFTCIHTDSTNSLTLCSQLPPKFFDHRDIPDYTPKRYSTHILSHNHFHPMCIRAEIGTRESLKFTFIHTDSVQNLMSEVSTECVVDDNA